ncbi:MAG: glycosyltransferase family 4 protein [Myxococcota bacterium]|nr:glycosyltransferase family 4 protein [Myxococcota bacterium]
MNDVDTAHAPPGAHEDVALTDPLDGDAEWPRLAPKSRLLFLSQVPNSEMCMLSRHAAWRLGPVRFHTGRPDVHGDDPVEIRTGPRYRRWPLSVRALSWLTYCASAAWALLFTRRVEVVLVNTNPPPLPLLTGLLCALTRRPWVALVFDVFPDALAGVGLARSSSLVYRVWARLSGWSLRRAFRVITLGEVMKQRLVAHGVPAEKITVLATGVDPEAITPAESPDPEFFPPSPERTELRVLYSGNLGISHDMTGLFDVLAAPPAQTGLDMLFVGGGTRETELRELSTRHPHVRWLAPQPQERLSALMGSAQVGLVTLGRGTEGVSMPSKAYYLMAAGCALLGMSHGDNDLRRLIEETGCGLNVEADDQEAVAAALARFREDPAFLANCQEVSRRAAVERFGIADILDAQLEILRDALAR